LEIHLTFFIETFEEHPWGSRKYLSPPQAKTSLFQSLFDWSISRAGTERVGVIEQNAGRLGHVIQRSKSTEASKHLLKNKQ